MSRFWVLIILLFCNESFASSLKIEFLNLGWNCTVRVVSQTPDQKPLGDVLFLTGFSDRADNHGPLFDEITNSGFRVISFDYPSHGETDCWNLDFHNFTTLSDLAESILSHPNYKSTNPLYLSGWSTGGLLAYRMAQRGYFLSRDLKGLVLLAPGLAIYKVPGVAGVVTQESLLSNPSPPHMGPISPKSPLLFLGFSASLLTNSILARNQDIPDVPILMLLGGDQADVYANTSKIKKWFSKTDSEQFVAMQCFGAKHELDNEIEPIGLTVRHLVVNFISDPNTSPEPSQICDFVE